MANAINVGKAERIGSAIGGAALVLRALARPSLPRIIGALAGAALLQRAFTGHCALYQRLGLDTAEQRVNRPDQRRRRVHPPQAPPEGKFPARGPTPRTPAARAPPPR